MMDDSMSTCMACKLECACDTLSNSLANSSSNIKPAKNLSVSSVSPVPAVDDGVAAVDVELMLLAIGASVFNRRRMSSKRLAKLGSRLPRA
jgi:hypothetical protein